MNKSLGGRFRCGSRVVIALGCMTAAVAPAEEAWLEHSRRILEESMLEAPPDWLRMQAGDEALALAEEIANEAHEQMGRPAEATSGVRQRLLIFGSFSIPETTLRALLSEASEVDVTFVLRGVPRDSSISAVLQRLRRLTDGERIPNVIIDPTLFRRYAVSVVPTMALDRGDGKSPIIVAGAVTADWLRRRTDSVVAGSEHLGRRGEIFEIAEADLIEEMQRRVAGIDWVARREAAIEGYWRRPHDFLDLPDATAKREYLIDPSVRVTQDLEDAEGHVLVRAGQTFNPLDWMPLSKTIVVFRGTDTRHVARAVEAIQAARAEGRGVILMTTTVDVEHGWTHLEGLERQLEGTVYVLPASLAERFHLSRVPAVITARGKQLLLTELPVGEGP